MAPHPSIRLTSVEGFVDPRPNHRVRRVGVVVATQVVAAQCQRAGVRLPTTGAGAFLLALCWSNDEELPDVSDGVLALRDPEVAALAGYFRDYQSLAEAVMNVQAEEEDQLEDERLAEIPKDVTRILKRMVQLIQ